MTEYHLPVLIPFTYLAFAVLIPLAGLWKRKFSHPMAVTASGLAAALSLYGFVTYVSGGAIHHTFGGWDPPVGIEFVYDGLSAFFLLVINSVAFLVLLHSKPLSAREFRGKRMPFYSVAMLLMLGFNGIISTGDLFNLYVFLEISSLSSYGLIAIGSRHAPFAAFRYLVIGTIGGSMYLLGLGFLYTCTGTLNILDMAAMLPHFAADPPVVTGLILMTVGIGIKAALFPMHGWLPDAYTFASSTSSALIAPTGTKVGAYILIRVLLYLFGIESMDAVVKVSGVIGTLAAMGIIYGSIMAIAQSELKRMLAYSSVSQIGYIIMGLSLGNPAGFIGAVLHVLNHAAMKACLFLVAGNLRFREGHSNIRLFNDTYRKKYPWTMASFTVAAVSMVGLPPMAGFFSKWYLVLGTIENANWVFLAVILVSSLLNAVYFFRVLEKVYMKNPKLEAGAGDGVEVKNREVKLLMLAPVVVLAVGIIVIGIMNMSVVSYILKMFPG
ncbi:MAG TPA: monovalent cation/H+ antiporter subunit D family protein [Desulfobacteraceae bacterium]|nr:monovalent cation/H+ antiporter subunit D family protein [Desulfobacteraceae bacterium]